MTEDLWKNLNLPEELRPFMTLSAMDVGNLTLAAMQAADPKAMLEDLLITRAKGKQAIAEAHKQKRMIEDAERLRDFDNWPRFNVLPLKTQPWVTNAAGNMRFGTVTRMSIERGGPVLVATDEGPNETFDSVEELVKVWSVD